MARGSGTFSRCSAFILAIVVTHLVGQTSAKDAEFHAAAHVRFGLNPDNEAWFEFINERGEKVAYEGLQHMPDLFARDLTTTTYSVHRGKANWATMTIIDRHAGLITATVHRHGVVATLAPQEDLQYLHASSENFRKLAPTKHVLTYSTGPWGGGSCVAKHFDVTTAISREAKNGTEEEFDAYRKEEGGVTAAPRPRPESRRLQRAPRWGNCFTGEGATSYMEIGLVVDKNFFETYRSDVDRTMKAIEVIVANTNLVYFYTFNMFLRVRQVVIPLSGSTGRYDGVVYAMFNQNLNSCPLDIGTALSGISAFSEKLPISSIQSLLPTTDAESTALASLGHWHLLTACYSSGTVGVAYVGTLCRTNLFNVGGNVRTAVNVGVSSRTFEGITWLTFAHEMGMCESP